LAVVDVSAENERAAASRSNVVIIAVLHLSKERSNVRILQQQQAHSKRNLLQKHEC